ncbi:hypothetical protein lbkm_0353 [Lachnospiraceae bacterium KM106-2]|nr:hypothetical protein lbkm_0353 [Lachnospiraceae bacterium KM106-2]
MSEDKRFAVLIDSENVASKYIKYILDEVSTYGVATYKRIYGDWTRGNSSWKQVLLKNSITPMQQYNYTTGKNATDSAMIIDAMDILYSGNVDGFCIVSSDSDFTRLAVRLRESGMQVVGMGETKTPESFRAACNIFKFLDKVTLTEVKEVIPKVDKQHKREVTKIDEIESYILKVVNDRLSIGKEISIAELGNLLQKRYSDFDVHNYNFNKLSDFLKSFSKFRIIHKNNVYCITLAAMAKMGQPSDQIVSAIHRMISEQKEKEIDLSILKQRLIREDKRYGHEMGQVKMFTKFLKKVPDIKVVRKENNHNVATFV